MTAAKAKLNKQPDRANDGTHVDELVTALLTASRALVSISARSLSVLDENLTLPQFRTLVVLSSDGEMRLNRLAEILDVNASSAVRMVDRLVSAGLVSRRENPTNRRQTLHALTSDGLNLVRRVTDRRRRDLTRIVTAVPTTRRAELVRALRVFSAAAGEHDPDFEGDQISPLGW
jgi:DNA-binding MarR family transcriptional regulator